MVYINWFKIDGFWWGGRSLTVAARLRVTLAAGADV